ncbi:hypothetical protein ACWPKS_09980 [Coraliomargarita sp. W4R72]
MKKILSLPFALLLLVSQLFGVTIDELENLDVISPELTGSDIVAFATNNDKIVVAVDASFQVLKSSDSGDSWTRAGKITVPASISFPKITAINYNGSVWVATGNFRSVSSDLETWDSGSMSIITSLGATYGTPTGVRARFVAVGQSLEIRYSMDGLTWSTASPPTKIGQPTLADVAFGDDLFVAVSYDGHIITSLDGVAWSLALDGISGLSGTADQFTGVRYLDSTWFATGKNGLLMTSSDAITWTLQDTGSDVDSVELGKPILRDDGNYAFSFYNLARFLVTDLSTFNVEHTLNGVEVYRALPVGAGFAGVSSLGTFAYSSDGEKWFTTGERLGSTFTDVEFGDGIFFIVDDDKGKIYSSLDGRAWTLEAEVTAGASFQGPLVKGPTGFIIRMTNNSYLYRENGTSTFEVVTTNELNDDTGLPLPVGILQTANDLWFGFDLFGGQVAYSPDLENWTLINNLPGSNYYAVAFGDGVYALVGQTSDVATSTNLSTWTDRTPAASAIPASFTQVTFDGNRFFTESTKPYVSSNSGLWEILSSAPSVGRRGFLQSSVLGTISFGLSSRLAINHPADDADDWLTIYIPTSASLNDGAEGNGVFVGVGDNGVILASPVLGPDYAAWVLANFGSSPSPADISPYADPEGDGIANIQEYARDTDPNNLTQALGLNISNELIDPFAGTPYSATLTFDVASAITEVASIVEFSKDLEDWRSNGVVLNQSSTGPLTTITATLEGTTAAPPLFMRVTWIPSPE